MRRMVIQISAQQRLKYLVNLDLQAASSMFQKMEDKIKGFLDKIKGQVSTVLVLMKNYAQPNVVFMFFSNFFNN